MYVYWTISLFGTRIQKIISNLPWLFIVKQSTCNDERQYYAGNEKSFVKKLQYCHFSSAIHYWSVIKLDQNMFFLFSENFEIFVLGCKLEEIELLVIK